MENQSFQSKLNKLESQMVDLEREVKALRKRIALVENVRETNSQDKERILEGSHPPRVLVDDVTQNEGIICLKTPNKSDARTSFRSTEGQDGENTSECNEQIPFVATPKRKRTLKQSVNVVTSDTEGDDDDSLTIAQLLKKKHQQCVLHYNVSECDGNAALSPRRRRRLVKPGRYKSVESDDDNDDDDDDNDESADDDDDDDDDNDDDSIGSFIVSSSENGESESDEKEASDDSSADSGSILRRTRKSKYEKSEWESEVDVRASLRKDDLLCMKGVCALYRRQTCDEQQLEETFVLNGRGFSKFDAPRGSRLAKFLTGGDPGSDVTKTVGELNTYYPNGVEVCRDLAMRYYRQLFDIYEKEEYPYFFHPSQ